MKERIKVITIIAVVTNIITSLVVLFLRGWEYGLGCLGMLVFYSEVPNTYNESYPFVNAFRSFCLKRGKAGFYCVFMGTLYALLYTYYLIMIVESIIAIF